ncbi:unnamed protein product [Anisakis simplex]|uniref:Similar to n=1 Tax=Anisakis simplex TaxID=6269 RepID=A0A0M3JWY8_ANISI|nr:unnamed protein product [Anisakis simplex]
MPGSKKARTLKSDALAAAKKQSRPNQKPSQVEQHYEDDSAGYTSDPELLAEAEYARQQSQSLPEPVSVLDAIKREENTSIRVTESQTRVSESTTHAFRQQQARAARKARGRGVSGEMSKKGNMRMKGRWVDDLMDDYDEEDGEYYDEEEEQDEEFGQSASYYETTHGLSNDTQNVERQAPDAQSDTANDTTNNVKSLVEPFEQISIQNDTKKQATSAQVNEEKKEQNVDDDKNEDDKGKKDGARKYDDSDKGEKKRNDGNDPEWGEF